MDPTIVRGLDYYTKTAFEFVTDKIGAQSTICGGGRYDNLISEIGGMDVPGVGFGLDIERLLMMMDSLERNLKGQLKYADRKGYRCAVIIGDNELASGRCQIKNLLESTQESVAFDELSDAIRKAIRK